MERKGGEEKGGSERERKGGGRGWWKERERWREGGERAFEALFSLLTSLKNFQKKKEKKEELKPLFGLKQGLRPCSGTMEDNIAWWALLDCGDDHYYLSLCCPLTLSWLISPTSDQSTLLDSLGSPFGSLHSWTSFEARFRTCGDLFC